MILDQLIHIDKQLLLILNGSESLFLDGLALSLTTATTWIPLYVALFYLIIKNNDSALKILLILVCATLCVVLAGTINDEIVKPNVARWRPTHDPEIGLLVDIVNNHRGGSYGFFSSHAANTFSVAVFFSLLIKRNAITVMLTLWSLINAWTRMYLGVHFPGDILCGLLHGAICGSLVYLLFYTLSVRFLSYKCYTSSHLTASGYKKIDTDIVIIVLSFTFVYALIRACLMSI